MGAQGSGGGRRVRERVPLGYDPRSRVVGEETRREVETARGGGSSLSPALRRTYEGRLGTDLSRVRVHTDARADLLNRQLQAEAFTVQNDVFFRGGTFAPGSRPGERLLEHELTHVAQYGGPSRSAGTMRVSSPHDTSEREAASGVDHAVASRSPEKESLKVETDRMVQQYVEGFDVALGKWVADHPQAMAGGQFLLVGIHKILKKVHATSGQTENAFLVAAFGDLAELAKMPGAPNPKAIDDILTIANSTAKGSLRTKMSLVYMAIRGGMVTAGMHAARTESTTGGGSQKARDIAVKTKWGLEGKKLREADVGSGTKLDKRKYFARQERVEQQDRTGRAKGESAGLAGQEVRTIGESAFVGITLSYAELKIVAKGDAKARAAATTDNKDFDTLGEDEKCALMIQEYADVPVPEYTPGFAVYRVDPRSAESQEAAKRKTGVVGGLSGSTDMYLHLASYLGASKPQLQLVRLAAFGEMLPRRDHSFYEVVIAGQGYGLSDIDPTKGVAAYAKIAPLTKDEVVQGLQMTLPSEYSKDVSGKQAQADLRMDLRGVQTRTERYATDIEAAGNAVPADLSAEWQRFFQATVYRWVHDARIKAAIARINAVLGATTGVSVVLTTPEQKAAAITILKIVQTHTGNPTRVVPEVFADPAWSKLKSLIGNIPANQVLAAYVKQYAGPAGLIIPSVQFAHELQAMESGAMPLPPITEIGDRANNYATQVWPEAKSELHKRAQAAEQAYADKVAALDRNSPTFKADKKALDLEYRRKVATGAVETWKRVEAQIQAAEALSPTERYAIYTYTQGAFYKELNPALSGERKLSTKERAVALAATAGLRKLPVYPGPVFRAQRTGVSLRKKGVSEAKLKQAKEKWKPGPTIQHGDFLSTFKHPAGPLEFMQTDQGSDYDLVVRIEKVKTGRWTLLLSAAEAVAAGMNPEHEGEVTFPPGSRFKVSKPLKVDKARGKPQASAYCETTWEEVTPTQAAPQGAAAPTIGDDKVPDALRPANPIPVQLGGPPLPPANIPLPPMRGPARVLAVRQVPVDVQPQVAVIVAQPDVADLVADVNDVKLPDPPADLVAVLLGVEVET